jgi:hypothetical protein
MRVTGGSDIWSGLVDRAVDHEGGGIQKPYRASVKNLAGFANTNQVRGIDQTKGHTKWIYPEGVFLDWASLCQLDTAVLWGERTRDR